jgi:hypothetical protein
VGVFIKIVALLELRTCFVEQDEKNTITKSKLIKILNKIYPLLI